SHLSVFERVLSCSRNWRPLQPRKSEVLSDKALPANRPLSWNVDLGSATMTAEPGASSLGGLSWVEQGEQMDGDVYPWTKRPAAEHKTNEGKISIWAPEQ